MIKNLITKQNETNEKKRHSNANLMWITQSQTEKESEEGRNLSNTVDYSLEFLRSGHL